ncbi:MAG: sulfatase-like hydrolase/transferase [Lachnospiraceae bacterium]|nr:sulfatase-like hydrolase/transferase [Lachnospiraceae bacterium]
MSFVHVHLPSGLHSWREQIAIRKSRSAKILAAVFSLVYVGLGVSATRLNGVSPIGLTVLIAAGLVGLLVFMTDVPVHWTFRLLFALAVPALTFVLLESFTHELTTFEGNAVRLNLILYYLFYALIFFISGRIWLTCVVVTSLLMICGIANYFVLLFRSAPIVPWDFYSISTAMSVAGQQQFTFDTKFAVICALFLTMLLISARLGLHLKWKIFRGFAAALFAATLTGMGVYLLDPATPEKEGVEDSLWIAKNTYKKNGFVLAFTMSLRFMSVSEPEGYEIADAEEILSSQTTALTQLPEELPNVVVIMSETFSDPAVIGEFQVNQDYMPFIRSLMDGAENTISGYTYVSIVGGNTANSEFEFLTGNSMKFFPVGSVPYQQYIHNDVDSVVDDFKEWGYRAISLHPYKEGGWKRNIVYPFMGFDDMLFQNDMSFKTKLRNYISDASDYLNLLSLLDKNEEPVFIHNVTMQNHSAYGGSYDNFDPQIVTDFRLTKSIKYLDNYLSLMYETDMATEDLLRKLSESDEKTIVCFFGDHQPNDYVIKAIYRENGMDIENQTLEQQQNRQMTPFFIWANYDIEEEQGIEISTNYLCNLLLQAAGLPLDEYRTYLESVREVFPVMNTVGYFNENGVLKSWNALTEEEQEVLDTYEKVQYYHMFDSE